LARILQAYRALAAQWRERGEGVSTWMNCDHVKAAQCRIRGVKESIHRMAGRRFGRAPFRACSWC
jgi:hypothetical protein